MDTDNPTFDLPLYHGTRDASARAILRSGFRRSSSRSYTGTGICLSESLTIAYEYGAYETGGCVLEARLSSSARWSERIEGEATSHDRDTWDDFFVRSGMDAVRGFAGNVWVVWAPGALVSVRRLSHREAIHRLCMEFDTEGRECGYNGVVQDYASIWWNEAANDPNLTRFPDHHRQLVARLKRMTGRVQSTRA